MPFRKASTNGREPDCPPPESQATSGRLVELCAPATSGHATAPPRAVINSRRFIGHPADNLRYSLPRRSVRSEFIGRLYPRTNPRCPPTAVMVVERRGRATSSTVRLRSPLSTVPAGIIVPTFPQRSPPWFLTKAARGGLGSAT